MQTITRPFWHRTPADDEESPSYGRRAKSHWIIRMLVFLIALSAGWAVAMGLHEVILWLHHPPTADQAHISSFIERGLQFLRSTFAS
jgi:hypothetical protein